MRTVGLVASLKAYGLVVGLLASALVTGACAKGVETGQGGFGRVPPPAVEGEDGGEDMLEESTDDGDLDVDEGVPEAGESAEQPEGDSLEGDEQNPEGEEEAPDPEGAEEDGDSMGMEAEEGEGETEDGAETMDPDPGEEEGGAEEESTTGEEPEPEPMTCSDQPASGPYRPCNGSADNDACLAEGADHCFGILGDDGNPVAQYCVKHCNVDADCVVPSISDCTARPFCLPPRGEDPNSHCMLDCSGDRTCPEGMVCLGTSDGGTYCW